ncbi:MAG: 50S ribosomal protein L28 [Bdellovibrionaceae bacterium]|nr:50S ribosomal protein L28 [Pseudobdellovibrionaceae bacterium]
MARCELSGKSPVVKNLVSHSNIKTKTKATPNVQKKRLYSNSLGAFVTLKVATSTLKSLEHCGGFDKYILNQDDAKMSERALTVKRKIARKLKSKKTAKTKV